METFVPKNRDMLEERLSKSESSVEVAETLNDFPTAIVCEFLLDQEEKELLHYLSQLPLEDQGRLFSYFTLEQQQELREVIEKKRFADIFTFMDSDERADLFQDLTTEEQIDLLPYLDKKTREDVIVLSTYPPETAGGIMSTDFATILVDMTCEQAINKIRKDAPSQKMIYYTYVVDHEMQLLGIITIKDLIIAKPDDPVEELYTDNFVYAHVEEDREIVAQKIEKYDLVALPVTNSLMQLVGIVDHEDAIDIIRAEHTEDMEKFMGIVPSEDEQTYLGISTWEHFTKRVVWIVSLAAIGLISGVIIHHYTDVLQHLIILALYLPMMTATGGNVGSQTATLVIRTLALGQAESDAWAKIIWKEIKISSLLGFCVGGLVYIKIAFFSSANLFPPGISFSAIALTIAISLAAQVISSAILGAGLPLLVRKLGGDPAVAASPAITTSVDITGLLIYFSIATTALKILNIS